MPDNASTKAADYATTHGFKILRVGAGMRAQAFATLQELDKELASIVAAAGTQPTLNSAKYAAMQNDAKATIADAYNIISKNHGKALDELAGIEWQASNKMINNAIGVDLVSGNIPPKLLEAITKAPVVLGHSSADWWNGQSADLRQRFQAEMAKGTLLGETTPQLLKRLRGAGVFETPEAGSPPNLIKKAKRDAEALILTSSASIANHARLESFKAKSDLIKGIEWVSTLDSRTTLICMGLDGKQWRFPDMQPVGHDKAYPGSTAHWRCFTDDTTVACPSNVSRLYRRKYSGPLFTLKTSNGRSFEATPNHPILTAAGWKPLREIQIGDQVVCQAAASNAGAVPPKNQERQATFGELFQATTKLDGVRSAQVPISAPDFHGDSRDNEIGEVWAYGDLTPKADSTLAKLLSQDVLKIANLDALAVTSAGDFEAMLKAQFDPTNLGMGGGDISNLASCPSGIQILGSASGNASGNAPSTQSLQTDSELRADVTRGCGIGGIEMDGVCFIGSREAESVFVHNLESDTSWYFAGGIVAHNCRSTIISVLYSWAELSGKKLQTLDNATLQERVDSILEKSGMSEEQRAAARVNTRASMDGQASKNHTYETWAKKKGVEFIEQVLGPGRASLYETGKMSFSDLTDQNNRPITLKQLAASVATGKPPPETLGVDFLPRPAVSAINAAQEAARVAAQEAAQAAKDAEKAIKEAKDAADKARIEAEIAKRSAEAAQAEIDRLNGKIRRDAMEGEGLTEDQSKIAALASRYAEGSMGSNLTKEEKLAWMNLSGDRKAFFDERVKSIREIAEAEAKITAHEYILKAQGLPIPERQAPVSRHLTTDNDDLRPHLKHALDSIDRVIDDGGLPDFVVKSLKAGASDYGAYTSSGYETKGIEVNTDADKVGIASFAAVHEIGHFLDHKLVGAVGTWGHEGRFGEKWRAAVQKTEAYKAIQKNAKASLPPPNKKMAQYLAKEQEVFARAFAQYIATKTNDPLLMRGLKKDRGASTSKYWSDAEFKTLIPVLDELFAEASARQLAAASQ